MVSPTLQTILRRLGHPICPERRQTDTDEMLLDCFFHQEQTEAFELLRRHGPMVLVVCGGLRARTF